MHTIYCKTHTTSHSNLAQGYFSNYTMLTQSTGGYHISKTHV